MILNFEEATAKEAAGFLKQGQIGILPTDTVYGIGCLPREEILDRFYEIKKRNGEKPTAVLVGDFEQLKGLAIISKRIERIIQKFWPGDLTLILPAKETMDPRITTGGYIGIRFPKDRFLQEILEEVGPLAVSSANFHEGHAPHVFQEINENLINLVDFAIRSNRVNPGEPSTVVKIQADNIILLRQGRISLDDLEQA